MIPLLNPNDLEGVIVALPVQDRQKVSRGELLGVLETTKSTGEIVAERDGFVVGLQLSIGQPARAGDILCYLAAAPDVELSLLSGEKTPAQSGLAEGADADVPQGLRITQPARILARQHHLPLSTLPVGPLITEGKVREILSNEERRSDKSASSPELASLPLHFDPESIIIYGGGGHGKSVIEMVRLLGTYQVVGVIDDGLAMGSSVLDSPVLGGQAILVELYRRGVNLAANAVGGIGNIAPRLKVFESLIAAGYQCPAIVHPRAFIEASAHLAEGVQVFPQAYIGSSTQVGFGDIINTGAIVSHDCVLGEFVNLSPGAILAGAVSIGDRTLVGMGVTINLEVKVGSGVRIGNGATVKADVPTGTIIKAGSVWPS